MVQNFNLWEPIAYPEIRIFCMVFIKQSQLIVLNWPNYFTADFAQSFVSSIDAPFLPFSKWSKANVNYMLVICSCFLNPFEELHVLFLELFNQPFWWFVNITSQVIIWRQTHCSIKAPESVEHPNCIIMFSSPFIIYQWWTWSAANKHFHDAI